MPRFPLMPEDAPTRHTDFSARTRLTRAYTSRKSTTAILNYGPSVLTVVIAHWDYDKVTASHGSGLAPIASMKSESSSKCCQRSLGKSYSPLGIQMFLTWVDSRRNSRPSP